MNLKKLNYRSYSSTGRANPWKEQNYADFFQGLTKVRVLLRPQKTSGKEARTANIGLAIWRLKCFYETFVQGSTAVILLNFSTKLPPHRKARKRYAAILITK